MPLNALVTNFKTIPLTALQSYNSLQPRLEKPKQTKHKLWWKPFLIPPWWKQDPDLDLNRLGPSFPLLTRGSKSVSLRDQTPRIRPWIRIRIRYPKPNRHQMCPQLLASCLLNSDLAESLLLAILYCGNKDKQSSRTWLSLSRPRRTAPPSWCGPWFWAAPPG
jgi:hypothetical protein